MCEDDAEVETDSVRDGVDAYELHDASDCGEDSLLLFALGATESECIMLGFWSNEESLCGCGAWMRLLRGGFTGSIGLSRREE